jgi:PAS domain-containing protein
MFIPDGVLVIDPDCNILLVNYAMLNMFGCKSQAKLERVLDEIEVGNLKLLEHLQQHSKVEVNNIEWVSK